MRRVLLAIGLKILLKSPSRQRAAISMLPSYARVSVNMPAKVSRRLVIDASVARAAGGEGTTHPTSKHCRDLLQAVLTICHRVVLTPDITQEWNTHQSRFARLWRVSMVARKKIYHANTAIDQELHHKIESSTVSARAQEAMRKDL